MMRLEKTFQTTQVTCWSQEHISTGNHALITPTADAVDVVVFCVKCKKQCKRKESKTILLPKRRDNLREDQTQQTLVLLFPKKII